MYQSDFSEWFRLYYLNLMQSRATIHKVNGNVDRMQAHKRLFNVSILLSAKTIEKKFFFRHVRTCSDSAEIMYVCTCICRVCLLSYLPAQTKCTVNIKKCCRLQVQVVYETVI